MPLIHRQVLGLFAISCEEVMEQYEEEIKNIEKMFANCPITFLRKLQFALECHILDRDTGYQPYLEEISKKYGASLKVVK